MWYTYVERMIQDLYDLRYIDPGSRPGSMIEISGPSVVKPTWSHQGRTKVHLDEVAGHSHGILVGQAEDVLLKRCAWNEVDIYPIQNGDVSIVMLVFHNLIVIMIMII